jgi:hypothetical protein
MPGKNFIVFVGFFLIGILGACFSYFLITQSFLPDRVAAEIKYKNILLERVPGRRLIIDSGSNSVWSIMPRQMEEALKRPTFVVADHGAVPLEAKIYRLNRFAKRGDIVVLPLEWVQYSMANVPSDFVEGVLGITIFDSANRETDLMLSMEYGFTHYYFSLPLLERMKFILKNVNLNHIKKAIARRMDEPLISVQLTKRLSILRYEFQTSIAGDLKNDLNRKKITAINCREYVSAFPLKSTARLNMLAQSLADLQISRDIKIVITWPAVAGKDCYDPGAVSSLVAQIRASFERFDILVVGDPFESVFAESHMLDTYYHIDSEGAKVRTERLISDLRRAGVVTDIPYPVWGEAVQTAIAEDAAKIKIQGP